MRVCAQGARTRESEQWPWIDTHCHLEAPAFARDQAQVLARSVAQGVAWHVVPAVARAQWPAVQALARAHPQHVVYALGIHPLYVSQAADADLLALGVAVAQAQADPQCVALGEIGLDAGVPGLDDGGRQMQFYEAQLGLASDHGLPVLLHVRRSADGLLKVLRRYPRVGGIVHAFNGSEQQAKALIDLGFKLGFGGSMTFERALQIRRLARHLPQDAVVLETDAPDMPPQWLYKTAAERAAGQRSRNEPQALPRIAQTLAELREMPLDEVRHMTSANALAALPRLRAWMAGQGTVGAVQSW